MPDAVKVGFVPLSTAPHSIWGRLLMHPTSAPGVRRANHSCFRFSRPALSRKINRFEEDPNQPYAFRRLIPTVRGRSRSKRIVAIV
jgi:hypothetical protein